MKRFSTHPRRRGDGGMSKYDSADGDSVLPPAAAAAAAGRGVAASLTVVSDRDRRSAAASASD